MVCYLSAISGVPIGHQGNFVGPFVSYILFVAYYHDLCRLEHLGIQFNTNTALKSKIFACACQMILITPIQAVKLYLRWSPDYRINLATMN